MPATALATIRGSSRAAPVHCRVTEQEIELEIEARRGDFQSRSNTIEIDLRAVEQVQSVLLHGQAHTDWDRAEGRLRVRLPNGGWARSLTIRPR
jgi:hypothetical protein